MTNKLLKGFFLAVSLLLVSAGADAATRYVRADGGTSTQCNGTTDAAYPGSGSGVNCAWTLSAGLSAMNGGDTLIIKNGTYNVTAQLPTVKDGTSNSYTVIAGEQYGNCRVPAKIQATAQLSRLLTLTGTDYVRVECLRLQDTSNCHYRASGTEDCGTGEPYVTQGIRADSGSNHVYRDLILYGMANGWRGARINNSTWERVKMYYNHEAGFHGAIPVSGSNVSDFTGTHTFTDVEIAFTGCSDDYPNQDVRTCIGQSGGGYGDAFGTYYTGGTWTFNRVHVHHSTQDGLDGRYFSTTGRTTISNSKFYANAGNQVKVWGPTTIENSFINSNCAYFAGYGSAVNQCRADGNAVAIFPHGGSSSVDDAILRYNTIAGESAALIQFAQDTGSNPNNPAGYNARLENNVVIGDTKWNSSTTKAYALSNSASISVGWYNNLVWNVQGNTCPSGSLCVNPQVLDSNVPTLDPRPVYPTSPLIGAANKAYTTPLLDVRGYTRPSSPAIGAFEPETP